MQKSRRRIIRTIFRKMVIRTKNGKESTLLDVYNYVFSAKIMEKILFFGVFSIVSLLILPHFGDHNLIWIDMVLEIAYVFIFIFLFLFLAVYSGFKSTKPGELSIIHYIISRSLQAYNTDLVEGWILFIIYSVLLILQNYVFLLEYGVLLGMFTIVLSVSFIFIPVSSRFLDKYGHHILDLESIIFNDGLKKVKIKLYIGSSPEIKGEIEDIRDELTVCTNRANERGTLYVPWENILSFEIVEEIVH